MKFFKLSFILSILLAFASFNSYAQVGDGTVPYSIKNDSCCSITQIQSIVLSVKDNDSLQKADSIYHINEESIPKYTFATPLSLNLSIPDNMTWDTLTNDTVVGRISLKSPNSFSSFLMFDSYQLPKGVKLYAYNKDKSQILGAFTKNNNKPFGSFSLGPVKGDEIILEVLKTNELHLDSIQLHLETFVHSYKDLFTYQISDKDLSDNFNGSASCNVNVKCPEGNGWCNQRRSVAMIVGLDNTTNFIAICTGSLITNEKRDLRPYFLTANHCQIGNNVNDWIFLFNYQSDNCNNPLSPPNTPYTVSGANLNSNRCKTDFTLLELSSRPPSNYNTYFAGWDNENKKPKSGVTITHPAGDLKKIAVFEKKASKSTPNFPGIQCANNFPSWEVEWDDGTIQKGSSGGSLFNSEGLIVGQVIGGNLANTCTNNDISFFGRFDKSWDAGGSASSRLKDWLNPNATSSVYILRMSGDDPCRSSYSFSNANDLHTSVNVNAISNIGSVGSRTYNGVYTASGLIETGQNVTVQNNTSVEFYGESIHLKPGFHTESGSNFIASPEPCIGGCSGVGKAVSNGPGNNDKPFVILNTDNIEINAENQKLGKTSSQKRTSFGENDIITIYPNPADDFITIMNVHNAQIEVLNIAGKMVQSKISRTKKSILKIDHLSSGVYLIKITKNQVVTTKKLVIQ